jgi:predicted nucleic acid-binding protein
MIVIADSGPLRYLILIDQIQLLPALYGNIVIPPAVVMELTGTGRSAQETRNSARELTCFPIRAKIEIEV